MSNITNYIFETKAIKFCKENEPFWLTSGLIAPYFFNTQFLYGSEQEAQVLLDFITEELALIKNGNSNKKDLPKKIIDKVLEQYNKNNIYHYVIDQLKDYIEKNIGLDNFEYISGGERRDWFFSNILAYLLKKPHITVFKDVTALKSNYDFSTTEETADLQGAKVLHVADMITIASSFTKMWVPAIEKLNGKVENSMVIIDRNEGGKDNLAKIGVKSHAIVIVDKDLLKHALDLGFINQEQYDFDCKYFDNPFETAKQFLIAHPEFVENSLKSTNERTLKRVHTMIDEDLYGLGLKD